MSFATGTVVLDILKTFDRTWDEALFHQLKATLKVFDNFKNKQNSAWSNSFLICKKDIYFVSLFHTV